jgi:hypothetical protein
MQTNKRAMVSLVAKLDEELANQNLLLVKENDDLKRARIKESVRMLKETIESPRKLRESTSCGHYHRARKRGLIRLL